MGFNAGEIDLLLNIDRRLFNSQISGLARNAQPTILNAFKPIGKLIGTTLAAGSIIKFTKDCLEAGSNLSEVQNVVDTTFGAMASKADEFAKTTLNSFGLSEKVTKEYMGTLGAMSKSMGFSVEQSYEMAEAVTKLTGDVASFYNLNSDDAFTKLKSIWTGETETLKSIGVLLTQTNLDQYALNNGFGKTTAKLTEQEKVMLRYQYTLSALSDASGDFAKTQNSWANQTRILNLQFEALKTTLGQGFINLFTPLLQMINNLLSGLSVLAEKFKQFTILLMGNHNEGQSAAAILADDSAAAVTGLGNIEDAAKAAAKATGLLKFDNLNNITTSSATASAGSGSAITDINAINGAAGETEGILGEVDARMEALVGNVQMFAGRIKEIINDFKVGDFFKAGKDTSDLATDILDFFSDAIDNVDWDGIGTKIGEFLAGIDWLDVIKKGFKLKFNIWKAIAEVWFGSFKAAPVETAIITALGLLKFTGLGKVLGGKLTTKITEAIINSKLFASMSGAWTSLGGLGGILTTDLATIMGAGTAAEIGMTVGAGIIDGIGAAIAGWNLGQLLYEKFTGVKIDISFLDQMSYLFEAAPSEIFNALFSQETIDNMSKILDLLNPMISPLQKIYELFFPNSESPASMIFGKAKQAASEFKTELDNYNWGKWADNFEKTWVNPIKEGFNNIKSDYALMGTYIKDGWNSTVNWFSENVAPWFTKEKWLELAQGIKDGISGKWNEFVDWWNNSALVKWWNDHVAPWFTKEKWTSGMTGIKDAFQDTFKNACNAAIEKFNQMINWINQKMHFKWDAFKIAGKEIIPGGDMQLFKIPNIPMLAQGGYVHANQPRLAIIGDNKREGEIVSPESKLMDMAKQAAASASGSREERELLLRIISLLEAIYDKAGITEDDIGNAARRYSQDYYRRTGEPAYLY